MEMQNKFYKSIAGIAFITFSILLIPLIAMLITDEVVWTSTDFIIAGVLIFGTGFSYKLITLNKSNIFYKSAAGIALGTAFLLVWANLAVGIIGAEDNPANQMYLAVLAVFVVGSIISRIRPKGMMVVMFATGSSQALVTLIALVLGEQNSPVSSVSEILLINTFFIVLWSAAGLLFRRISRK